MANRRGFTLIEVLVVLVIAAIVMSVLISVMGSSFEILRAGESKARLTANARLLLDYIANDLQSASYIPLSSDRDLNGWPDEVGTPEGGTTPVGYREDATWRVARIINEIPMWDASFFLSEAWSDRLMTRHFDSGFGTGAGVDRVGSAVPKVIRQAGQDRSAQWISFIRLAVPANAKMPYYLTQEADRNGDGSIDPNNSGITGGVLQGYPEQVAIGPHKETAVAIQDYWYALEGDKEFKRVRQIPISSNITRIRFEYFHEVPVYQSRIAGGQIELFAQNITDGSVGWIAAGPTRTDEMIPLVDHWEQRIVDVAYNGTNSSGGFWTDPATGTDYGIISYRLQDQYPEGFQLAKLDGNHVNPGSTGLQSWNCTAFYEIDNDGDDVGDNAPIDRLGYVTTGLSSTGTPVEGGIAQMRPDMELAQNSGYWNYSLDPTGQGDFGDADGIPDGDGQPDDPIPGWWLPYLRAVRVTVVATPTSVIEDRMARSGQQGSTNDTLYYRLDSPVPFADQDRLQPLYNQKKDFIGPGADLVLTKTVPVNFAYKLTPVTDPKSDNLSFANGLFNRRRVELNFFQAAGRLIDDPASYDSQIVPGDPVDKLWEYDPEARENFFGL